MSDSVMCSCGKTFRKPETLWKHYLRERENVESDIARARIRAAAGLALASHIDAAHDHEKCPTCVRLVQPLQLLEIPF